MRRYLPGWAREAGVARGHATRVAREAPGPAAGLPAAWRGGLLASSGIWAGRPPSLADHLDRHQVMSHYYADARWLWRLRYPRLAWGLFHTLAVAAPAYALRWVTATVPRAAACAAAPWLLRVTVLGGGAVMLTAFRSRGGGKPGDDAGPAAYLLDEQAGTFVPLLAADLERLRQGWKRRAAAAAGRAAGAGFEVLTAAVSSALSGSEVLRQPPPSLAEVWAGHRALLPRLWPWLRWPRLAFAAAHTMLTAVLYLVVWVTETLPRALGMAAAGLVIWLLLGG
jgi:hypothetical protein